MRLRTKIGLLALLIAGFLFACIGIPELGANFVKPLCDGDFQVEGLRCFTGSETILYEDYFAIPAVISGVIAFIFLLFGFVFDLIGTSIKLDRILREGEPAEATILEMNNTGTTVNDQPLLKFRLHVRSQDGKAFEAETKRVIPHSLLGTIALGSTIPVKYDPLKPEDVALDLDAFQETFWDKQKKNQVLGGIDDGDSLSEKLQELEEAYRLELITKEEYEAARQQVLRNIS